MKPKEKRNRQADLVAANQAIDSLTKRLELAVKQTGDLVNVLAAILIEHHHGKVNIAAPVINQTKRFAVKAQAYQALGFLQIKALSPEQIAAAQHPLGVPVDKEAAQEPETPLACTSAWHVNPDAMGARCPECGNKAKLESCQAVME